MIDKIINKYKSLIHARQKAFNLIRTGFDFITSFRVSRPVKNSANVILLAREPGFNLCFTTSDVIRTHYESLTNQQKSDFINYTNKQIDELTKEVMRGLQ